MHGVSKPINWSQGPINILGVSIPIVDRHLIHKLNYDSKLQDMQTILNMWQCRQLTLQGKITILKSLIMPKLVYNATMLTKPPLKLFKQVETMIFKFIWNKNPDKIKRSVMYNTKENGGLDVPNFQWQFTALKVKWANKLLCYLNDNFPPCDVPKWVSCWW
jgi:hypothetical protein